ncbi:uncharacterized protein LOC126614621 [Malus sylvestris]|uniref:uncharacterized protein LOC126614621 n=1 Tax=Malus sylvestris TaxID=3752 RepID=UPI0021ABA859|nr:uncharacterized protein LOC126614621 [Malus sylvestris]
MYPLPFCIDQEVFSATSQCSADCGSFLIVGYLKILYPERNEQYRKLSELIVPTDGGHGSDGGARILRERRRQLRNHTRRVRDRRECTASFVFLQLRMRSSLAVRLDRGFDLRSPSDPRHRPPPVHVPVGVPV